MLLAAMGWMALRAPKDRGAHAATTAQLPLLLAELLRSQFLTLEHAQTKTQPFLSH